MSVSEATNRIFQVPSIKLSLEKDKPFESQNSLQTTIQQLFTTYPAVNGRALLFLLNTLSHVYSVTLTDLHSFTLSVHIGRLLTPTGKVSKVTSRSTGRHKGEQ